MARWDSLKSSGNVEDRRGLSGTDKFAGGGVIAVIIALGLNYFLGINVSPDNVEKVLDTVSSLQNTQANQSAQPPEFAGDDSYEVFTKKVVGSTDDVWTAIFAQDKKTYQKSHLVLFRNTTNSGCGLAQSAVGPFYCPQDATIYLDETFFDELHSRFGGDVGQVAQAYVIAHEVGHHVQDQLGTLQAKSSVETELQADCYAGIWAYAEAKNGLFADGDINQALSAASAVGDDNIQQSEGQPVNPETWTHGSSKERVNAFTTGYTTGQPDKCINLAS